jgi:5-methylcytosine-specific restriction enzyme subunit McrC
VAGDIPIRNLYALLAFHWYERGLATLADVTAVKADTPLELLARLLIHGTRAQIRRGLHREYVEHAEDLVLVRGAIDVSTTVQRGLLPRRVLHCRFDELVADIAVNRLIKATLREVMVASVPADVRRAAAGLALRLEDVADVPLAHAVATDFTLPRAARSCVVLVEICRLIARDLLPDTHGAGRRLRDLGHDDERLAWLFEGFVRGFAQHRLGPGYSVGRTQPPWSLFRGSDEARALLPRMNTDATIRGGGGTAVLECKFVREPFRVVDETGDRIKLRSSHLYQLFAYVTNLERAGVSPVTGTLVYASVGRGVAASFDLGPTSLAVHTVDLAAPWEELEAQMVAMLRSALPWWSGGG